MGSLGWPEILMILVIALIVFGPRKLPELGKSLGQSLAQFRRASEDFKRQWEEEVEVEKRRLDSPPAPVEPSSYSTASVAESPHDDFQYSGPPVEEHESAMAAEPPPATVHREESVTKETKRDWM